MKDKYKYLIATTVGYALSVLLDRLTKGMCPTLIVLVLCFVGGIYYRFFAGDAKFWDIAW
jgi:uncharacterized membrane protein